MTGQRPAWWQELRRAYLGSLPGKLAAMEHLVESLLEHPDDDYRLQALRLAVHRLAGTAGSYGLEAVSELACAWELRLAAVHGRRPTDTELEVISADLQRLLRFTGLPGDGGW